MARKGAKTEETVATTDDLVSTTDELVEIGEDAVETNIVTSQRAVAMLREVFGPLVDVEYLTGKTMFRDALAARFELSQLTAEDLCDELERVGCIRFVTSAEGAGWHVHADADEA